MKKKQTKKSAREFELMKIELGVQLPKVVRKNTLSDQMFKVLKKLPVGGSFLIKSNQDSLVRKLLTDQAAEFKDFNITIRQATEGKDYRRVYRLAKKDKK